MTTPPKAYSYIRFSTPDQRKGDSLRRQLEASRQYAKTKGFELDESLTIQDLGISAFKGDNRTKGALGAFIGAIEGGTVPSGSLLIVESLDRLSRQQVMDALSQFTAIINKGVKIVTLADGQEYSREGIDQNWTALIMSLAIMSRAHEESATKSKRVKASWDTRRGKGDQRKATSLGPQWLRFDRATWDFVPIPERVEIVKLIFKLALDGWGVHSIRLKLNESAIPTFKGLERWRASTVHRILKNRRVLGEWQPQHHERKDGQLLHFNEGAAIPGYYPAIIDPETFYAVQKRIEERKSKPGRRGFGKNLFPHMVKCGYCGGVARFTGIVGPGGKYKYFQCDTRRAGGLCGAPFFNYQEFEKAFLSECKELDVAAILPNGNGRAAKIKAAQQAVDAAKGELTAVEKLIGNAEKVIDTASSEGVIALYVKKLDVALAEKTRLEKRLAGALSELVAAQSETTSTTEHLRSMQELIGQLETAEGQDLIQLRDRLKNAIGQLVKRIDLFPNGLGDRMLTGDALSGPKLVSANDLIADWENIGDDRDIMKPGEHEAIIGKLSAYTATTTGKHARAFLIQFAAGGFRLVQRDGKGYINAVSTVEEILGLSKQELI